MSRRAARTVSVLAIALAALLGGAGTASASCAGLVEESLPDAAVAFVGTVRSAEPDLATFVVDEVWQGPDLAPVVTTRLELADPADLALVVGSRYVVGAYGAPDLTTNECIVGPATDELRALAPLDVRTPTRDGLTGATGPERSAVVAAIAAAVLASAGVLLLLRRRRGGAAAPDAADAAEDEADA